MLLHIPRQLAQSPTGTGKSMALLCSALAYQNHIQRRAEKESEHLAALERPKRPPTSPASSQALAKAEPSEIAETRPTTIKEEPEINTAPADPVKTEPTEVGTNGGSQVTGALQSPSNLTENGAGIRQNHPSVPPCPRKDTCDMEDDDDFDNPKRFRDSAWQMERYARRKRVEDEPENSHLESQLRNLEDSADWARFEALDCDREYPRLAPRIFYGSRTHAQLRQVVGELKNSGYRPHMAVLGSRNEYCIHPDTKDMNLAKTNEFCADLRENAGCEFYGRGEHRPPKRLAQSLSSSRELCDIEELAERGKNASACPYYTSVQLLEDADLVLCPYNYLTDKLIRKARDLPIRDSIVILDEAHNIEDMSRESASFSCEISSLVRTREAIEERLASSQFGKPHEPFAMAYSTVLESLLSALSLADVVMENGDKVIDSGVDKSFVEKEAVTACAIRSGISNFEIGRWQSALETIRKLQEEEKDSELRQLGRRRGFRDDEDAVGGQRNAKRSREKKRKHVNLSSSEAFASSMSYCLEHPESFTLAVTRSQVAFGVSVQLHVWCLNPSVTFNELASAARSVVVASGTLAPTDSYAGELGVAFGAARSLPHVVDTRTQVFASVVASGPNGVKIDCTYRGSSNFRFQDELGEAIHEYCSVIPGGVLVFFPSYRLMKLLSQRWHETGAWGKLETVKGVVVEEPTTRGEEFTEAMSRYSDAAASPAGAVMLGVCRGKISEGLDFRDDAARGVLIVGIPYPNMRDLQVMRKRAWNERMRLDHGRKDLLSSSAWYDMQAFRALNQALGRCVRHRHDYGSIVLLDARFRSPHMLKHLPAWILGAMRTESDSHVATVDGLRAFFEQPRSRDG